MDADSLIRTLKKYDASFDGATIRTAFHRQGHGLSGDASIGHELENGNDQASGRLASWAASHVTPDTLLSVDELSQFTELEASGLAEKLAGSVDLATVQAFSDQEIRDAIEELTRSTDAISKQTETLRQQHEALGRLVNSNRKDSESRSVLESSQAQRLQSQVKSAAMAVEELSQILDNRILELEQQNKSDGTNVQQMIDSLLRSDDKLVSSLQKLGWELDTEDPEEQDNVVMLRETCARLIKFTVEGLRTKLDRIYLESLDSSVRSGTIKRVPAGEVTALQDELESLYAEILPVAQMSTEHQFLEPALRDLAAKNGHGLARSEQAMSYIDDCLEYLLDHIQELSTRVEAFQEYQLAAASLAAVARSELATDVAFSQKKECRPTMGGSPSRRRSLNQGAGASPARVPPRQRHGRRSSGLGIGVPDDTPLEEILRSLAINLPADDASQSGTRSQANALATILGERRTKVEDVAHNVQESFESSTTKQLADVKMTIQLVRDSLLAESQFGQVQLVDPEIDGSIAVLGQELEDVRSRLEGIDATLTKARGKSVKKEELIRRWGS
ncbi:hypothetical protein QBC37DRAFT_116916 [Rhypophila decipiens]|uniref:Uncharacterized protein n=1 Tax=Rhypophila decipiens TaxID=261697 RepID=A0AAN6YAJ9_9PEZI|nr:hypothetical protein QBC37DRAFT_116916 [Rhypophila decipiens]